MSVRVCSSVRLFDGLSVRRSSIFLFVLFVCKADFPSGRVGYVRSSMQKENLWDFKCSQSVNMQTTGIRVHF